VLSSCLIDITSLEPLGSEVPAACDVIKNNCPAHYICATDASSANGNVGECICDRFYGFHGYQCRNLGFASYMLVTLLIMVMMLATSSFTYNLVLVYLMFTRNKVNPHVYRVLFFNTLHTLPAWGISFSYICIVFEVDRNLWLETHICPLLYAAGLALYFVASTGISVYWIELIEKVRGRRNQHNTYKCLLYGCGVLIVLLTLLSHFFLQSIGLIGLLGTFIVGYSYHYGGKMVVKSLRRTNLNRISSEVAVPSDHVLDLANAVELTARMATLYTFLLAMAFISLLFLLPSGNPMYPQQNSLPRWLQGQISAVSVMVVGQLMDIQIVKYFHFTLFRDVFKYVPLKRHNIFQIFWNLTVLRDDVSPSTPPTRRYKLFRSRQHSEATEDSISVELTSTGGNLNTNNTNEMISTDALRSETMAK
jgi:hypothetical protein